MQITVQSKKEEEEKKANKTLMVDAELFKKKKPNGIIIQSHSDN